MITFLKNIFVFLPTLCFRKIKHKLRGETLSEKGKRLREYLCRVILENYEPQTLTDYDDEKAFNPNALTGEERILLAKRLFAILAEF